MHIEWLQRKNKCMIVNLHSFAYWSIAQNNGPWSQLLPEAGFQVDPSAGKLSVSLLMDSDSLGNILVSSVILKQMLQCK